MSDVRTFLTRNRTRLIVLALIALLFLSSTQDMEGGEWLITVLRGLSVGAVTFLVAAGLSLILGLMDVLNLAHGEMYMIGAYVGWTVYVRPDTFVDVLTPVLIVAAGLVLWPFWRAIWARLAPAASRRRLLAWAALLAGALLLFLTLRAFPLAKWDPEVYAQSPITFSLLLSQGTLQPPAAAEL